MKVEIRQDTSWKRAYEEALVTTGNNTHKDAEPSDLWKYKMLIAEHSPIKLVEYTIKFKDLRQWVGVHILRHHFTLPFIHTQREDKRKLDCERDKLPQGSLNDQDFVCNAQTLIDVSRKRLCRKASPETREAWEAVVEEMLKVDKPMALAMQPNCVYRGFCCEMSCCGYADTDDYKERREQYIQYHKR